MRIADIVPYGRNARRNERAIPAVADSIRGFGLRGQIVLESRENPVIVTGHTRVAACRSLGWEEIPDGHIAFCDGMTPDQIKAYRIADNRTGEIAMWRAVNAAYTSGFGKIGITITYAKQRKRGGKLVTQKTGTY